MICFICETFQIMPYVVFFFEILLRLNRNIIHRSYKYAHLILEFFFIYENYILYYILNRLRYNFKRLLTYDILMKDALDIDHLPTLFSSEQNRINTSTRCIIRKQNLSINPRRTLYFSLQNEIDGSYITFRSPRFQMHLLHPYIRKVQ